MSLPAQVDVVSSRVGFATNSTTVETTATRKDVVGNFFFQKSWDWKKRLRLRPRTYCNSSAVTLYNFKYNLVLIPHFLFSSDSDSRDCYPGEWGCPGSTQCIAVGQVCDEKPDCPGGTDESNSTAQQTCSKSHERPEREWRKKDTLDKWNAIQDICFLTLCLYKAPVSPDTITCLAAVAVLWQLKCGSRVLVIILLIIPPRSQLQICYLCFLHITG